LNTPSHLLTREAGGGLETLDEELYDATANLEIAQSEDIIIISGTITVSP